MWLDTKVVEIKKVHDQNLDEIDHVDVLIGLLTSSFILSFQFQMAAQHLGFILGKMWCVILRANAR